MNKPKTTKKSKTLSRRDFISKSALGAGAIGSLSSFQLGSERIDSRRNKQDNIKLNMAGYDVFRVKALFENKVTIKGCSFKIVKDEIGNINTNLFSGPQSYDVCEIGLHPFMLAYANNNFRDYSLLPIFPLRMFRHKSVFIRTDRGIKKPQDLIGKKIGTPGYSSTSLTWIRGIFQDEYGVNPEDIEWVVSSKDSSAKISGKVSKQEQVLPENINISQGSEGKDESELLVSGEVDALFHAVEPKAFVEGNPIVSRLFPDSRKVEREYYAKTGIFPIMHTVAIKNELLNEYPWLAESVFNAYSEAKTQHYMFMKQKAWAWDSLPWYSQELDDTISLMGKNFWPYGIEPNRKSLEALFRYSFEQGLSKRQLKIEDLFAENSLDLIE
jgi:4,5-dihydroxyphthalate decarboxylase